MANAFDDLPPGLVQPVAEAAAPNKPNAFDDITPPVKIEAAKAPATAADRVQAAEGGVLKGGAYLAGMIPDAAANLFNLGKAGVGTAYGAATGKAPPSWLEAGDPNPVGGWIARQMDKSPITTTQPNRPDDTASRYLQTAGTVGLGAATGGGGLLSTAGSFAKGLPPALAGQYVAEKKPFQSDWANNAASIATQAAGSLVMPRGHGADVPGNEVRNQTVRDAQEAGMVFPPATTNPTSGNRLIENLAGKMQVQQHATLTNRDAVNAAARTDLGIGGHGGISESELAEVRAKTEPAYQAVRQAGRIAMGADPAFVKTVQGALNKYTGAGRVLSNAGDSGIRSDVADILSKPHADAGDVIDTISVLRDRSKTAFRNGDAGIGSAYRQVSNALEDQIEKGIPGKSLAIPSLADRVTAAMNPSAATTAAPANSALQNFREARRTLAVAHSVEDARNEGSGDINAQKLASQLHNGVPLSGNLLTAAKAASMAGKAFAPVTDSKGVNHLGLWGGVMGAGIAAHEMAPDSHWGLAPAAAAGAWHGGRLGARKYALGPGQSNAIAKQKGPLDQAALLGNYLSSLNKQ